MKELYELEIMNTEQLKHEQAQNEAQVQSKSGFEIYSEQIEII